MAAIPWVVWIVSAGLRSADRGTEEEALQTGGSREVMRRVLLPRAVLASAAAAGWVAIQAATEIPITDAMMVRTFAEEVYTEIVSVSDALTGAIAATVPAWIAAMLIGIWVARSTARAFDAPPADASVPAHLRIRAWQRAALGLFAAAVVLIVAVLPVAALVWKAGGGGTPAGWRPGYLLNESSIVLRTDGTILIGSFGSALATGLVTAGVAWVACRLSDATPSFGRNLFVFCVVLAVAPGPLVGLGLKNTIRRLVDVEAEAQHAFGAQPTFPPLRSVLYDQPSPIPASWAAAIRLFPLAVAVIWPAMRAVPRELLEAARLDGLGALAEWRLVLVPLTGPAAMRAALAVTALALGEVSAGKVVNPPFRTAYILRLFDQMHYGAEATVAALCLFQVVATTAAAGLLLGFGEPTALFRNRARTG
jgi:iron(III) transport system permease protein